MRQQSAAASGDSKMQLQQNVLKRENVNVEKSGDKRIGKRERVCVCS